MDGREATGRQAIIGIGSLGPIRVVFRETDGGEASEMCLFSGD